MATALPADTPPNGAPRGVHVLALSGDLDAGRAPALRTALIDALGRRDPRLILDLGKVTSCAEPAVRVIEEASARAWRRGGWLRLAAAPPPVVAAVEAIYGRAGPTLYGTVAEAAAPSVPAPPAPARG